MEEIALVGFELVLQQLVHLQLEQKQKLKALIQKLEEILTLSFLVTLGTYAHIFD